MKVVEIKENNDVTILTVEMTTGILWWKKTYNVKYIRSALDHWFTYPESKKVSHWLGNDLNIAIKTEQFNRESKKTITFLENEMSKKVKEIQDSK